MLDVNWLLGTKVVCHFRALAFGFGLFSKSVFFGFCSFWFAVIATITICLRVFYETFRFMLIELHNNN